MLSKTSWQWLADNHRRVRTVSVGLLSIGLAIYGTQMWQVFWDQGKAPTPYRRMYDHMAKWDCKNRLEKHFFPQTETVGEPSRGYDYRRLASSERSLLLLHLPRVNVIDSAALHDAPECIGALLADTSESPDNTVTLVYDRVRSNLVYRIEHNSGHVQ